MQNISCVTVLYYICDHSTFKLNVFNTFPAETFLFGTFFFGFISYQVQNLKGLLVYFLFCFICMCYFKVLFLILLQIPDGAACMEGQNGTSSKEFWD